MKALAWTLFLCFFGVSSLASPQLSHTELSTAFLPKTSVNSNKEVSTVTSNDNNFNVDDLTDGDNNEKPSDYVPVMSLKYTGHWNSSSSEFGFFTQKSGMAEFTTAKNYFLRIDDFLIFTFFDGEYTDQKYAVINFIYNNKTDFHPDTSTIKSGNTTFFMYLFYKSEEIGRKSSFAFEDHVLTNCIVCKGSYQLDFMDSSTGLPYQRVTNDQAKVYAQFQLNSSECNISLSSTVSVKDGIKPSEMLGYTIAAITICTLQLWSCIRISKDILQSEPEGLRISLISLGFFVGWDVFLCLFYLYNALTVTDYFNYFLAPAFCYFVLVSIFETRLILLVWKSKYYTLYQGLNQVRRGIVKFYLMFYGFLTGFLILCYFFLPETWIFYVLCPFFIPQIVHNAIRGQRYKFNKNFVFVLGLLRISLPMYAKGYSNNIFRLTPDGVFPYVYSAAVLAQIIVLFLQSKLGSRFFVPACLLPPKYNYFVKVNPDLSTDEDSVESCPICMEDLNQTPGDVKSPLMEVKRSKKLRLMQTPCKHQFHEQCLRGWMDLKLECPSCRTKLPPID